jgi:integrase/recombinase XerD
MFYEEEYDQYLSSIGRTEGTRRHHRQALRTLIDFLGTLGIDDVKAVCSHHVEAFANHLAQGGYKGKTLAGYLIRIRVYFEFLQARKTIFLAPTAGLRIPRYQPGHHAAFDNDTLLSRLEQLDTGSEIGLRARAILELAYSAALRPREVRALKTSDVDEAKGQLFLEQSKNRKDRIVPVGPTALAWVTRYWNEIRNLHVADPDHGYIFVSHTSGQQLSARGLVWAIEEACRQAGIETLPIYTMRASAATNLLESGMGIVHISRLLGHVQIKTTQIYLRTRERALKDIVASQHPRFRYTQEGGIPA